MHLPAISISSTYKKERTAENACPFLFHFILSAACSEAEPGQLMHHIQVFSRPMGKALKAVSQTFLFFYCAVHEVLEAQRSAEEALDTGINHVQISVVVQRADCTGAHEQILCSVHQLIANLGIGAGHRSLPMCRSQPWYHSRGRSDQDCKP